MKKKNLTVVNIANRALFCKPANFKTDVIKLHVCTKEELVGRQLICLPQNEKQQDNLKEYLECN